MRPAPFIEFDQWITADGLITDLRDYRVRFIMGDISGQGLPPIGYSNIRSPRQHGNTTIDYRLRERTMQFVLRWQGSSRYEYWELRDQLMELFRPNRFSGAIELPRLRKIRPDGSIRDIYVRVEIGPGNAPGDPGVWDEWAVVDPIRIVAPDPTFFDPQEETVTYNPQLIDTLTLPFTLPTTIGEDNTYNQTELISYEGNWESRPVVRVEGPLTAFRIENESTGIAVQLLTEIPAGDFATLDFENQLFQLFSGGANIPLVFTGDSELSLFKIVEDPVVANGQNAIRISGAEAALTTVVSLTYFNRYIGI